MPCNSGASFLSVPALEGRLGGNRGPYVKRSNKVRRLEAVLAHLDKMWVELCSCSDGEKAAGRSIP